MNLQFFFSLLSLLNEVFKAQVNRFKDSIKKIIIKQIRNQRFTFNFKKSCLI